MGGTTRERGTRQGVTALAPWFGSKRLLAPEVVKLLGPHRSYWGLFCGSLAVELAKPPAAMETVCDLHGDLTNLAWCLQDEGLAVGLYDRLSRTLPAETLYLASQGKVRKEWAGETPDADRAYHYLFNSWLGRNGMAGTCRVNTQIAVRWTQNGGSPAGRFRAVAESIPWWHERLRNILVLRRDAFAVAGEIEDAPATAIYADPPYILDTRTGRDAGGRYRHEFSEGDHERLAAALCRLKRARVVVSYYASPKLADLYPGWSQVEHTRPKHLSVQGRRGAVKQEAPEVLLVNGPVAHRSLFAVG